jgi:hypothetical protein
MTSSSRRKPRTTRPGTASRRSECLSALAAAALLSGLLPAGATASDWRTFLREVPPILAAPAAEPAAGEMPAAPDGGDTPAELDDPAPLAEQHASATPAETDAPLVAQVAAAEPMMTPRAGDGCGEDAAECRDALQKLRADALAGIDLDIRVAGRPGNDYPCECRLEGETFRPRRFATTMFTWKAAGYCHKPLYFEDWQLERYGHSHGALDPVLSAAHFFVTLPVLPYKMGVELPWECVYPLGHYRPGSCAPWTIPAVPISGRGLAVQAATVTGIVFLLP